MSGHFNDLTPAEQERLAFLAEECAEVIVAVGKILRHGYDSFDPTVPEHATTNREALVREMGDVRAAMILLCDAADVSKMVLHSRADEKVRDVGRWMHHQP